MRKSTYYSDFLFINASKALLYTACIIFEGGGILFLIRKTRQGQIPRPVPRALQLQLVKNTKFLKNLVSHNPKKQN